MILPASSAPRNVKPFRSDDDVSFSHVLTARNLVVVVVAIADPNLIRALTLAESTEDDDDPTLDSRREPPGNETGGGRRDASRYSSPPLIARYSHHRSTSGRSNHEPYERVMASIGACARRTAATKDLLSCAAAASPCVVLRRPATMRRAFYTRSLLSRARCAALRPVSVSLLLYLLASPAPTTAKSLGENRSR